MNSSFQADTDDSYTRTKLLIGDRLLFDFLACKLNACQWISKLRKWRANCSCQYSTDDAYTRNKLLIAVHAVHLFLIF